MFGFEDFLRGQGGMGRGGGSRKPVDNEGLYKTLGVDKKADARAIKKAYFKLARVHHPDKGGDEEKFKEIQKAYDVLSDESKRELYDRYGEEGLQNGGSPAPTDIFDLFRGGGRQRRQEPRKPEEIVKTVDLTLTDVYYGPEKPIQYKYTSATKRIVCSTCGGQGAVMQQVRAGPGMIMQTQRPCPKCSGQGISFENQKSVNATKNVRIPKGAKNNEKIKLSLEGHQLPGMERGDVVIVCRVMKHRVFERLGADLAMKKQLTLKEALCGFEFKIQHVSGTTLTVRSGKKEIVSPGQLKRIDDWGLPQKGSYDNKGHLYIKFEVLFPVPGSIGAPEVKKLAPVLESLSYPKEEEQKITLGMGVRVQLVNLNSTQFNGKMGTIIREEAQRGRWPVELDAGKKVAVPESCLKIVESKSEKSKKPNSMETEDYEEEETVMMTAVEGEPKFTPAAVSGTYDEDEEEEGRGMECRHM
uniref:J domain-containing protein n=2 Tax=Lotharella globosa TaxID=91324 RepID=A0A7S3ZIC0_9EUKA|mmetsp:Transcript_32600/g.62886  ORF Transcript_32600/g.62886 Transcript_32600/m.62886 type:complete len:471 (-) Transcript_32600:109-1521(-)